MDLATALSLCVSTRCAFRVKKSTTDDGDKRIDLLMDLATALSLCVSTRCAFRVKKSTTDDGDKRID
jgi:hypothetical protein